MIVDEAHNIMRVFEDASSASFTAKDIALALSECDFVLDFQSKAAQEDVYTDTLSNMPNIDTSQVYALKDCLTNFEKGIVELSQKMSNAGNYTGEEVIRIFESCGVTSGNASLLCTAINAVMDGLSVLNMASGTNKGKGLAAMNELVEMLYLDGSVIKAEEKMKSFYRFHVSQVESKFGKGKDTQFNLWCFHPGFSLNSLVRCNIRTLILTSGTLKPMNSFQNELGAKFSVQLQNGHVINAEKQINYQVISNGPDGQELISTFASRSNVKYLSSLGQSLVEIAKVVPDGLLVFFPSYAWMDTYLAHWKQIGIWERLNHWKQCFVEPKDRSTLAKTVDEFRTKVRHVSRIGACFLAVCRGKVSEGIDFADADARAVVITGIPFPSVYDPKVSLKKKFLDSQKSSNGDSSSAGGLSGAEWYNLEAFRAINQAVGRVIRHKDDFGAVLLLDKRFAMEANTSKLSSWLPKANKSKDFKASVKSLENFFSQHQYVPKKPKVLQPVAVQMQNKKRPTTCVSSQTVMEQAAKGPPPKRQRIVIKSRVTPSSSTDDSSENPSSIPAAMTKEDETKSRVNSHRPQASADIQCFVLRLKERLEKKELKNFIGKVREYKEQGNIAPLAEQIKSYSQRKLIHQGDVSDFRPFVRQADVKTFDAILLCDDGKE